MFRDADGDDGGGGEKKKDVNKRMKRKMKRIRWILGRQSEVEMRAM
jgi:hypothetical protein